MALHLKKVENLNWQKQKKTKIQTRGWEFKGEVTASMQGYCVSCKKMVAMSKKYEVVTHSKLNLIIGECSICQTEIYKKKRS